MPPEAQRGGTRISRTPRFAGRDQTGGTGGEGGSQERRRKNLSVAPADVSGKGKQEPMGRSTKIRSLKNGA